MKNYLIISLLFLSLGFSQKEYNFNDIIEMDNGLYTEKFSDEPITGKVYGGFGEVKPFKKVYVGNLLNGKKEGRWKTYFHSNGKKKSDENWKKNKKDGLVTWWYENGKKKTEATWKNGKEDGLLTMWYDNGQKWEEGTFKDGKQDGLFTEWYENGQKKSEMNFKYGNYDGLLTIWYENGQKWSEGSWKSGFSISYKKWNEDGSVKND